MLSYIFAVAQFESRVVHRLNYATWRGKFAIGEDVAIDESAGSRPLERSWPGDTVVEKATLVLDAIV